MKVYKQHILIIDILIDSDDNMHLTFDSSREINTKIKCLNNITFSDGNGRTCKILFANDDKMIELIDETKSEKANNIK